MKAISPAKACDPQAVYSAKSFSEKEGPNTNITKTAQHIYVEINGHHNIDDNQSCRA